MDRRTHVVYAGSKYDEGFPLPPAEAALCGCVVVGFAKNGDLEWMDSTNSFMVPNHDALGLYRAVRKAQYTPQDTLQCMNRRAVQTLEQFTAERTWQEIANSLTRHVS